MGNLFFTLLDMSLAAGWVALIVMVLRFLLKKAPHALVCALWALVAVRLICPITWQAPWSLMPKAVSVESYVTMSPPAELTPSHDAQTTVTVPSQTAPPASVDRAPTQTSETPTVDGFAVAAVVWMVGVVGMLAYAVVSTVRLRRQVRASVRIEKGIYECDAIASPFILGLFRPRIYLPSCMTQAERDHVIAHERAHIKRLDHAIKPFGFLLLSIYWFHPLLWVAYMFLCRDMELACDERVIRRMNGEDKASYSEILLKYSLPQRAVTACPLGFGEGSVKTRIRAIVNYKKPTFWIVAVAVLALVVTGFCFLFNPPDRTSNEPVLVSSEETISYDYAAIALRYSDDGKGYAVVDLNSDGQTELIIGDLHSREIDAWYTWDEPSASMAQLCQTVGEDHYFLYADSRVKREWQGDNGSNGWDWYRREQNELVLEERIVCDPLYAQQSGRTEPGEYTNGQRAYYRSHSTDKTQYEPISYDEAMALVRDWEARYAPITVSLRFFDEPMPIDDTTLPTVQARYSLASGEGKTLSTEKANEVYRYVISLPWSQYDAVTNDAEQPYVYLEFSGERYTGVYWIHADDTVVHTGHREMSMLWRGKLPDGTYRELVRRIGDESNIEPFAPTSDRLVRTADWQTTGLASVGLSGVRTHRQYDGTIGTVWLLSRGDMTIGDGTYLAWSVAVETPEDVWLLPTHGDLTSLQMLKVVDLTGDGTEELVVAETLGGQGGEGGLRVTVYALSADGVTCLFEHGPQNSMLPSPRFSSLAVDNGFTIHHPQTGYKDQFAYDNPDPYFDRYSDRYSAEFDELFCAVEVNDENADGVYTLLTKTYTYHTYRANHIGFAVEEWAWDGRQIGVIDASFDFTA